MDILMSSLCIVEKKSLVEIVVDEDDFKETSSLNEIIPPPLKLERSESIRQDRFILDEEVEEEDPYKWYEVIGENRVKRNNNDETLTPEGLPTIEKQLEQIEQRDIEQIKELSDEEKAKKENKETLMRIKCIALDAMGKNILIDPKSLQPRDKREFIKRVEELYILTAEEIKEIFNNICHDTIFQNGTDYSNFPVYDA
jgi:hypothetical protein